MAKESLYPHLNDRVVKIFCSCNAGRLVNLCYPIAKHGVLFVYTRFSSTGDIREALQADAVCLASLMGPLLQFLAGH